MVDMIFVRADKTFFFLKKDLVIFILCVWPACLCVYHVNAGTQGVRRGCYSPGTVHQYCEPFDVSAGT